MLNKIKNNGYNNIKKEQITWTLFFNVVAISGPLTRLTRSWPPTQKRALVWASPPFFFSFFFLFKLVKLVLPKHEIKKTQELSDFFNYC